MLDSGFQGVSHSGVTVDSVTAAGSCVEVGAETWIWGKNRSGSFSLFLEIVVEPPCILPDVDREISRNDFFSGFMEGGNRANDSCLVREVNDHHRDTEPLGRELD